MRLAEQNGRLALEGIQEAAVGRIALGLAYSPGTRTPAVQWPHPTGIIRSSCSIADSSRGTPLARVFLCCRMARERVDNPLGHALNALKNARPIPRSSSWMIKRRRSLAASIGAGMIVDGHVHIGKSTRLQINMDGERVGAHCRPIGRR